MMLLIPLIVAPSPMRFPHGFSPTALSVASLLCLFAVLNPKQQKSANAQLLAATGLVAIRKALDGGAKVNAKNKRGESALLLAALRADASSIEALIDAGIDVNAKDRYGGG